MQQVEKAIQGMPEIDLDAVSYLGEGDFGTAYSIGNNKVLKITTSKREFEIARDLVGKDIPAFAKVYLAEPFTSFEYKIILEEVNIEADIDYCFYEVLDLLRKQGLDLQYLCCFDIDEYEEEFEEIPDDIKAFIAELEEVVRCYKHLGLQRFDIHADNLGRGIDGTLKAFDLDEPGG